MVKTFLVLSSPSRALGRSYPERDSGQRKLPLAGGFVLLPDLPNLMINSNLKDRVIGYVIVAQMTALILALAILEFVKK